MRRSPTTHDRHDRRAGSHSDDRTGATGPRRRQRAQPGDHGGSSRARAEGSRRPADRRAAAGSPFTTREPPSSATPRELPTAPVGAAHLRTRPRKWLTSGRRSEGPSRSPVTGHRRPTRAVVSVAGRIGSVVAGNESGAHLTGESTPWTLSGFMMRQDFLAPIPTVLHGGVFRARTARGASDG